MKGIDEVLKNADLLQYKSAGDILDKLDDLSPGGRCEECDCSPCIWSENKEQIQHDNSYLLSENDTNKQRRFYAYKQMVYALHGHLGKGQRRELPKCVVEGIRMLWPENNKRKYVGFKAN